MSNQFKIKKILILGSSGQIGSSLTRYLKSKNYEVEEFDLENEISQDLRIRENARLIQALQNCQFVFFLAFDVGGSHYLEKYQNTVPFMLNNLQIIANTIEQLEKTRTPFIYASSQMATMDFSTYGLLKAIGERASQSSNGRVVHFWNVFGLETQEEKFHVISDFIRMAMLEKKITMRTRGDEKRDFLYVDDCSEALEKVMLNFYLIDKVENLHIAKGEFTPIIDIAEFIGNELGASVQRGEIGDLVQKNHVNYPDPGIRKYWSPKVELHEGVRKVIHGMKEYGKYSS